jgi:hypothetical protein
MTNGTDPPEPIPSPLPEPKPEPTPITREDDPEKRNKLRLTHVVRVWGMTPGSEKFWVDLEVIDRMTFSGSQYPGLMQGNQSQDTTIFLDHTPGRGGNREKSYARVDMDPEKDPKKKTDDHVMVPAIDATLFRIINGEHLRREFINGRSNIAGPDTPEGEMRRVQVGLRIASNNIDEEFLVVPGAESTGGNEEQLAPPSNTKKYVEAVRQSDDEASLWLDVWIPYQFFTARGTDHDFQAISAVKMWADEPRITLRLPGVQPSNPKDQHVLIDPYSAIVNFGPDTLPVEFHEGEGPPKEEAKGSPGKESA